ncbi:MAG: hypothetical protein Q7T16_04100 [Candidatus Burarchaeum sp.]|nr:hypothetical protein [Candidatus Burarchaeum sp.]MDO8339812.1 hypothetical protein [Candidatus Burarchaeum sp.]
MGDILVEKSKQFSTSQTEKNGAQGANFVHRQVKRLADGQKLRLDTNRDYKLICISGAETAFNPKGLSKKDAKAYGAALSILEDAAQIVTHLSNRLRDSADGMTTNGVEILLQNKDSLNPEFLEKISPYLLAILKNGATSDGHRLTVYIPPCERSQFEAEIGYLPAKVRKSFDWSGWLDHIYDPVPKAGEGFYLFKRQADWARFEVSLDDKYAKLKRQLEKIFTKALTEPLEYGELKRYDDLSSKLIGIQKAKLEEALKKNKYARGMCTRVSVGVSASGKLSLSVVHYTEEFRDELSLLARQIRKAKRALPQGEQTAELRAVLEAQAKWCLEKTKNPDWGKSLSIWVTAKNAQNRIDCNFTCEEKVSTIGQKSDFQIHVSQFAEVPSVLQNLWEAVQERASKGKGKNGLEKTNILLLETRIVGGHNVKLTVSGEKLPDPANEPWYKSMTFTNTTAAAASRASAEAMAFVTGISPEELGKMPLAVLVAVILHEFGHTLGDHAKFLEERGGYVEETNAQASAIYLTLRFLPEILPQIAIFDSCWTPPKRAQVGIFEQHSRSDLVLFEANLRAGAIEIVEKDGRHILQVRDLDLLVKNAFEQAIHMRLLEKGIPSKYHGQFLEPLNPADPEQDVRITQKAIKWMKSPPKEVLKSLKVEKASEARKLLKAAVSKEAEKLFSDAHMRKIGKVLEPVLDDMKRAEIPATLYIVLPGYKPMEALVV